MAFAAAGYIVLSGDPDLLLFAGTGRVVLRRSTGSAAAGSRSTTWLSFGTTDAPRAHGLSTACGLAALAALTVVHDFHEPLDGDVGAYQDHGCCTLATGKPATLKVLVELLGTAEEAGDATAALGYVVGALAAGLHGDGSRAAKEFVLSWERQFDCLWARRGLSTAAVVAVAAESNQHAGGIVLRWADVAARVDERCALVAFQAPRHAGHGAAHGVLPQRARVAEIVELRVLFSAVAGTTGARYADFCRAAATFVRAIVRPGGRAMCIPRCADCAAVACMEDAECAMRPTSALAGATGEARRAGIEAVDLARAIAVLAGRLPKDAAAAAAAAAAALELWGVPVLRALRALGVSAGATPAANDRSYVVRALTTTSAAHDGAQELYDAATLNVHVSSEQALVLLADNALPATAPAPSVVQELNADDQQRWRALVGEGASSPLARAAAAALGEAGASANIGPSSARAVALGLVKVDLTGLGAVGSSEAVARAVEQLSKTLCRAALLAARAMLAAAGGGAHEGEKSSWVLRCVAGHHAASVDAAASKQAAVARKELEAANSGALTTTALALRLTEGSGALTHDEVAAAIPPRLKHLERVFQLFARIAVGGWLAKGTALMPLWPALVPIKAQNMIATLAVCAVIAKCGFNSDELYNVPALGDEGLTRVAKLVCEIALLNHRRACGSVDCDHTCRGVSSICAVCGDAITCAHAAEECERCLCWSHDTCVAKHETGCTRSKCPAMAACSELQEEKAVMRVLKRQPPGLATARADAVAAAAVLARWSQDKASAANAGKGGGSSNGPRRKMRQTAVATATAVAAAKLAINSAPAGGAGGGGGGGGGGSAAAAAAAADAAAVGGGGAAAAATPAKKRPPADAAAAAAGTRTERAPKKGRQENTMSGNV
jgi:hypothetical protein